MEQETEITFLPLELGKYTVYSKSNCPNCVKVKELLRTEKIDFANIDCDLYLLDSKKTEFLAFVKQMIGREWTTFPMVFDENGQFIGGFKDTIIHIERLLEFSDDF
jgi:glutaredoxin